jgi:hypothetical protein
VSESGKVASARLAREAIREALCELVHPDGGQLLDVPAGVNASPHPPAAIVGPPRLSWTTAWGPDEAAFTVFLVVAEGPDALDQLLALIEPVTEAIDRCEADVTVRSAEPGQVQAGGTTLPAYLIRIEGVI